MADIEASLTLPFYCLRQSPTLLFITDVALIQEAPAFGPTAPKTKSRKPVAVETEEVAEGASQTTTTGSHTPNTLTTAASGLHELRLPLGGGAEKAGIGGYSGSPRHNIQRREERGPAQNRQGSPGRRRSWIYPTLKQKMKGVSKEKAEGGFCRRSVALDLGEVEEKV
jgi:hypothetical protein